MTPGSFRLALYRGDTYEWRFVLWADVMRTVPLDLTGVVAASEIRDKPGGMTIVTLTCVVTEPNIVDVTLAADDSKLCPPKGMWDLQLTYPDGVVRTVVAGDVMTTADVTDSTKTLTARSAVRSAS